MFVPLLKHFYSNMVSMYIFLGKLLLLCCPPPLIFVFIGVALYLGSILQLLTLHEPL
jgi:hypothetical protein